MKKFLAIILISLFVVEQMILAAGLSELLESKPTVKFGPLLEDEVWQGRVLLIGDVTIPEGRTLIILPGTEVVFDERDILESGQHKDQCELIVYGKLEADAPENNPVKMVSVLGFDSNKVLELDSTVRIIRFAPYKVETEGLREEFRTFRYSYLITWGLIYVMWVMVRNI
jgi:hypothetical protein